MLLSSRSFLVMWGIIDQRHANDLAKPASTTNGDGNAPVNVNPAPPPRHMTRFHLTIQMYLTTAILADVILTLQMVEI